MEAITHYLHRGYMLQALPGPTDGLVYPMDSDLINQLGTIVAATASDESLSRTLTLMMFCFDSTKHGSCES